MKCVETRKKLNGYCDGRLNASEIKSLEKHVSECANCAKALAETQKIFDGLQKMREIKAPEHLAGDVRRQIEALSGRKPGLKKIFSSLPFKIPLELAATFLIGIFIYRVILPHHPIGKGPNLKVEESSYVKAKNRDADLKNGSLKQDLTESGRLQKMEMALSEEDQVLSRKRMEVQKDFAGKEKSETAVSDEGSVLPRSESLSGNESPAGAVPEIHSVNMPQKPAGKSILMFEQPVSSGAGSLDLTEKRIDERQSPELQSGTSSAEPKMSPPMTAKMAEPADTFFRVDSQDEVQAREKLVVPVIAESEKENERVQTVDAVSQESSSTLQPPMGAGGNPEYSPLMDVQLSGFAAAGKGRTQANEAVPKSLNSLSVQQNALKEEKPQERGVVSESLAVHSPVQPAAVPEKMKIQKEARDEKYLQHYVWRFPSEEIRKQMFLWVQEKGGKAESRAVKTFQIFLPLAEKENFLKWLNVHGKLLSLEETADPENSDVSHMIILDLEFEEAF